MADRTVIVNVNKDLVPTKSDKIPTDVLSIEMPTTVNLKPGDETIQINLIITNNSHMGRMGRVSANYDNASGIIVQIPESHVYIGPQSKTVIPVLLEGHLNHKGVSNIMFRVH